LGIPDARGLTLGNVPKGIPQHPQVEHLPLQIIRLGKQLVARNVRPAVLPEHACDLGEGKASRFPEFDQGQLKEDVGIELPPKSMPADGLDQANLLIVA
jgi:hypothetical protein